MIVEPGITISRDVQGTRFLGPLFPQLYSRPLHEDSHSRSVWEFNLDIVEDPISTSMVDEVYILKPRIPTSNPPRGSFIQVEAPSDMYPSLAKSKWKLNKEMEKLVMKMLQDI